MNKKPSPETILFNHFRQLLPEAWGAQLAHLEHGDWDVELRIPSIDLTLALHIRLDPRVRDFPFGIQSGGGRPIPVLAAPRVSERLRERLREAGWGWLDGAGNAYLSIPGTLLIERSGHAHGWRVPAGIIDLGTPLALQAIRAILHPDHASRSWTLRELQRGCAAWDDGKKSLRQPSLGLVSKLVRQWIDDAYLRREGTKAPVRLSEPEALLKAAGQAYRGLQRVECFTLLPKSALELGLGRVASEAGGHAVWAAFSAADQLAPAVSQNKHWIMVARRNLEKLKMELQAKEVDSGGNLVLLVPDDDGPFYAGESIGLHPKCTGAVQTYWDLLRSGGRGEEAAQAVLEKCLRPHWAAAGGKP